MKYKDSIDDINEVHSTLLLTDFTSITEVGLNWQDRKQTGKVRVIWNLEIERASSFMVGYTVERAREKLYDLHELMSKANRSPYSGEMLPRDEVYLHTTFSIDVFEPSLWVLCVNYPIRKALERFHEDLRTSMYHLLHAFLRYRDFSGNGNPHWGAWASLRKENVFYGNVTYNMF